MLFRSQEFFVADDRVAQGAALLLDRIVRQGRAFGIHVILGSQTLGGAYSLARATLGQMVVRIALQCNEADSQLILSDENLAARLLSRPGEAIYNDAGGRVEGNSPFQVAFLPDEKRDTWLGENARRAKGRFDDLPRIVFEGDARAPIRLSPAVRGSAKPDPRGNVRLWLGEAVAIKDPTCVRLARAAGATGIRRRSVRMMASASRSRKNAVNSASAKSAKNTAMFCTPSAARLPHDARGACTPSPRNDRNASESITDGMVSVA